MNLPKNGRIVIVDNELDEAAPLISILSKKRIPFNYYSGTDLTHFPDDVNTNKLRVLFLDLNIFDLSLDAKSVISSIDGILKKVIPDNPNPYVLVIWSKQDNEYKLALENHFTHNIPNKIPAKIIFLKKGKYFDYVDGKWTPQEDCLSRIEADLGEELNHISLMCSLINWENIVHEDTSETIGEFSSFYPIDNNWDKNTKAIMFRLAKAIAGSDDILGMNNTEKIAKAFININSFLLDRIENRVENYELGEVADINDTGVIIPDSITAAINTKLHASFKKFNIYHLEQGNLYAIPNQDNLLEKILWLNAFKTRQKTLLDSAPQLVQLDITPTCDYSQNKEYVRTIFGVLLEKDFFADCKGKGQYYYQTPIMKINGRDKFILFDFRYIKTLSKGEIIGRNLLPVFKLRREICTDIQSQLANQVNRPGISSV
jgi:hypothetical protein